MNINHSLKQGIMQAVLQILNAKSKNTNISATLWVAE